MIKCPFCHFDNEDGALFCEQCKSDLAGVDTIPTAEPIEAVASAEIIETIPLAAVPEGMPVVEAMLAEPVMAMPYESHGLPPDTLSPAVPVAATMPETSPMVPPMELAPTHAAMPDHVAAPSAPTATPLSAPTAQTAPETAPSVLSPGAQPRLLVLRGLKRNVEYPVYEGHNFIGRADEKPVDIDLDDQEPPDRVWSSRQHALITFEEGRLQVEDLNSSNGTFVNRGRIYPGQNRDLAVGDVIQIGTVQMKVIV